jgi:uncharacterized protein with HEPN domain
MFNETTLAKLEFVLLMIEDIEKIVERHSGLDFCLDDVEGHHAIMMCLLQIGESLSKIKEKEAAAKLPVGLAYKMRNVIAHNYLGVNLDMIKSTINNDIPELKKIISGLLAVK